MGTRLRYLVLAAVLSLAPVAAGACRGDSAPTEPASDGILTAAVAGFVRDSLGGRPVAEALVTTAVDRALTDASGRFEVNAPRGRTRFHVAHAQYSLKSFSAYAEPGAGLTLEIAPLGPTVLGCEVRQGVMWMLVADLQGRKTIVRRDSSGVTLGEGPARRWVVAHDFTWWALDELRWLVDGPPQRRRKSRRRSGGCSTPTATSAGTGAAARRCRCATRMAGATGEAGWGLREATARVRFELTERLPVRRFSRPLH